MTDTLLASQPDTVPLSIPLSNCPKINFTDALSHFISSMYIVWKINLCPSWNDCCDVLLRRAPALFTQISWNLLHCSHQEIDLRLQGRHTFPISTEELTTAIAQRHFWKSVSLFCLIRLQNKTLSTTEHWAFKETSNENSQVCDGSIYL